MTVFQTPYVIKFFNALCCGLFQISLNFVSYGLIENNPFVQCQTFPWTNFVPVQYMRHRVSTSQVWPNTPLNL